MVLWYSRYTPALIVLALLVLGTSCSSGNNAGTATVAEPATHPAAWNTNHPAAYKQDQTSCTECHGPDLMGGKSKVSCFSPDYSGINCHSSGPTSHVNGWTSPGSHGASAKAAPDQSGTKGFSGCTGCHGSGLNGDSAPSCLNMTACHGIRVAAPHPPAPWRSIGSTHVTTNQANAETCAVCHLGSRTPASYSPLPSGVQAGCFNNTLCHGSLGHTPGWSDPLQHGTAAQSDFSVCAACHGAGYQGGTATTSCYQCHTGPGLDHPAPGWVVSDHKTAAVAGSAVCGSCHGSDYLGGAAHVACKSCHMEDRTKVHMLNWYPDVQLNHRAYAAANGTGSCATEFCHGKDLSGVTQSGPSCSSCHTWPYTAGSCGSCHGVPPAGANFPDTAGRHPVHTSIDPTITCDTCHSGAGSGTANHRNGSAEIKTAASYNAKSGAASFNAASDTCSNISCHGGKTTPGWLAGSISVSTQCTACHAYGTTQYNGFSSGRHNLHVNNEGAGCTECHDTAKLAEVHFNDLGTAAMTQGWNTLLASLKYTGTGGGTFGSCTVSCHGMSHNAKRW